MYPTLIEWGDLRFHSYTVMMTLAFLVGAIGPNWLNKRRADPFPISPAGGIVIVLAGMAGAKLYWVLQYGDASDWRYLQFVLTGGLVFFGGLFGGIFGGIAYLKYVKAPILPVADMVAPFMALAHGIGRIGCFLNACCWGSMMKMQTPWGVTYPKARYGPYRDQILDGLVSADSPRSLPVHPTQLYETFGLTIICIVLLIIYRRHKHAGVVTLSYLTLYGGLRFVTEAFRGESTRSVFGMTVSQTVGLSMLICAGLLLLTLKTTLWRNDPLTSETEQSTAAAVPEETAPTQEDDMPPVA